MSTVPKGVFFFKEIDLGINSKFNVIHFVILIFMYYSIVHVYKIDLNSFFC